MALPEKTKVVPVGDTGLLAFAPETVNTSSPTGKFPAPLTENKKVVTPQSVAENIKWRTGYYTKPKA